MRHVRDRSFKVYIGIEFRTFDYGMPIADNKAAIRTSLGGRYMYIFERCGDREVAWILLVLTALVVLVVNVYAAALP